VKDRLKKISHKDLRLITRFSNWSEEGVQEFLKTYVYNGKSAWSLFLKYFLLSLGIGFIVVGVVFFFAYNWDSLSKTVKLGLVEGLLITTVIATLLLYNHPVLKKIVLTGAAALVGVLFAVFGQIYQTGANAYDFFLAWTLFISLWVLVANFPATWLLYVVLINTTFTLYVEQVMHDVSSLWAFTFLFLINLAVFLVFVGIKFRLRKINVPNWFIQLITLATLAYATLAMGSAIFDKVEPIFWLLLPVVLVSYSAGSWYGYKNHNLFYLATIPFSIIVIGCCVLIEISDGANMFFVIGLFVVISVTLLVKGLIDLQRRWGNG